MNPFEIEEHKTKIYGVKDSKVPGASKLKVGDIVTLEVKAKVTGINKEYAGEDITTDFEVVDMKLASTKRLSELDNGAFNNEKTKQIQNNTF